MALPPPPVGFVRITSDDPRHVLTARLADERPDVSQSVGGWDVVERPRRKPITTWKSAPNLTLTLPILLDRWRTGESIEKQISVVESMGTNAGAKDGDPPILRIDAQGGAVPHQERRWVMSDLSYGDALMNERGDRVRQFVTLTLIEYVEDVLIVERSAANRRRRKAQTKKHGASSKRIVAKRSSKVKRKTGHALVAVTSSSTGDDDFGAGEDLLTIAARELGDADRWLEIAELNGIRDPRAIAPGQVIRLP